MVAPTDGPRTLTQMLREWEDDALVRLLTSRPDLIRPAPTSLSQLAARATSRQSVCDAVASLSVFDLWVARRTLEYPEGVDPAALEDPAAPPPAVRAAVDRLVALALVWGGPRQIRPVRALGTVLGDTPAGPPPTATPPSFDDATTVDPRLVEQAGAGSAFELVRRIEVAVEHCDHHPLRMRSNDQPSVRDLRRLGSDLDVPQDLARIYVALAVAARLLGTADESRGAIVVPTTDFDAWQQQSLADQWAAIAEGWWHRRPPSGSAAIKDRLADAFGDPADGRVLGAEQLAAWLRWHLPLNAGRAARQVSRFVEIAPIVGVTALGALTPFGHKRDASRLAGLLPSRVDSVVVQADLTAVAAGPLTAPAAHDLAAMADVESRGGATVYRFSAESLRRAQQEGWAPHEMEATLQALSRTPLPQPLRYLIAECGRQPREHNGPRAGAGRPRPGSERRLALPTDDLDGGQAAQSAAKEVVRCLRQTTDVGRPSDLPVASPSESVGESAIVTLREAVETREVVWFSYVDSRGGTGERLVHAISVDDGRLSARDARSREALSVPVHRITSAHIIRHRR